LIHIYTVMVRVSRKFQITIPSEKGDCVDVELDEREGMIIVRPYRRKLRVRSPLKRGSSIRTLVIAWAPRIILAQHTLLVQREARLLLNVALRQLLFHESITAYVTFHDH